MNRVATWEQNQRITFLQSILFCSSFHFIKHTYSSVHHTLKPEPLTPQTLFLQMASSFSSIICLFFFIQVTLSFLCFLKCLNSRFSLHRFHLHSDNIDMKHSANGASALFPMVSDSFALNDSSLLLCFLIIKGTK